MNRIVRLHLPHRILCPVAAFLLIAAGPVSKADGSESHTADHAEIFKAYPNKFADACYDAPDHDTSDLCAQWRAALAAEAASNDAWWGVIAAFAGSILSLIGTILLVLTLRESRRATKAARDAADSAVATLHSDRAWMLPSGFICGPFSGFLDGSPVKAGVMFSARFKNSGRTPALNVRGALSHQMIDVGSDAACVAQGLALGMKLAI